MVCHPSIHQKQKDPVKFLKKKRRLGWTSVRLGTEGVYARPPGNSGLNVSLGDLVHTPYVHNLPGVQPRKNILCRFFISS